MPVHCEAGPTNIVFAATIIITKSWFSSEKQSSIILHIILNKSLLHVVTISLSFQVVAIATVPPAPPPAPEEQSNILYILLGVLAILMIVFVIMAIICLLWK